MSTSWSGLPVIFDEVFTGLYRLGRFSSASFLGDHPDISVHAKLLTGGLVPLCTTLASQSIFEAFLSEDKSDALLHGHSYTAHAMGCQVAEKSLKTMMGMERKGKWEGFKRAWDSKPVSNTERVEAISSKKVGSGDGVWSMWSEEGIVKLSHSSSVESVVAIGSVLAISLEDQSGGGESTLHP